MDVQLPSSIGELKDPVALSEERLREVFDHEFKTPDGTRWQTSIAQPVIGPRGQDATVEGDILVSGRIIGHFTRRIDLRTGGTVRHFDIHIDESLQGRGFGRMFTALCAKGYAELGIEDVTMETGSDGLATWPRLGFELIGDRDQCIPGMEQSFYDLSIDSLLQEIDARIRRIADVDEADQAQAIYDEVAARNPRPSLHELVGEFPEWSRTVMEGIKLPLAAKASDLAIIAHDLRP